VTFEIELNGRGRTVSIERAGPGRYRVTVDGVAAVVDAQPGGQDGVSLLFPDRSHEGVSIQFAPGQAPGELLAYLGGRNVAVSVNGRRTGRAADTAGGAHGEQKVVAPMPGRVLRVLVAPGDEVELRQPVVVVEAMKMENELRAAAAGIVTELHVHEGQSVDAGTLLAVLGPA
jgi:biotin carboxyl carrier protein